MSTHTLEEGVIVKKDELLSDISKVYREGLYHDITLVFPDGVRVSTNRFMLACRIPYFATLLSSDFTDKSSVLLSLEVCSSDIFKKILDFVWTGELQLSDMHLSTNLILLEAARFLCLDLLVDGIWEYINYQFTSKKIDLVSALNALEFSISHNFPKISNIILGFVNDNIEEISSLPEFQNVSTDSMMMIISSSSNSISVFKALLKWLECNKEISPVIREEIANKFDPENFSNSDLELLEKSSLFSDRQLLHLTRSRIQDLEEVIETLQPARFPLTLHHEDVDEGSLWYVSVWKMDTIHDVSCVEFDLHPIRGHDYPYTVRSSSDGVSWDDLESGDCKDSYWEMHQVFPFQRRKMQFLEITLEKTTSDSPCIIKPVYRSDISNVHAALL